MIIIVMNTKLIQKILNLYLTIKIIFLDFHSKITERKSETYYYMVQKHFLRKYEKHLF